MSTTIKKNSFFRKRSGKILNGTFCHEVELAAEEEDSNAVVLEVPEAAGGRLAHLDAIVETFGEGVCDWIHEVGQHVRQIFLQRAGRLFDLLQAGVDRSSIPGVEEALAGDPVVLSPELDEEFHIVPDLCGLQIALDQIAEGRLLGIGDDSLQPEIARALVVEAGALGPPPRSFLADNYPDTVPADNTSLRSPRTYKSIDIICVNSY